MSYLSPPTYFTWFQPQKDCMRKIRRRHSASRLIGLKSWAVHTVCLCGPLLFLWIVCQQDREMQRSFQNEVDMECYPPTESRIVSCSFVTSTMICPWNVTRNGSSLGRLSCFQQLIFIWYQSSSWSLQEGHPPSDVNHLLLLRVCYTVCIERGYYSAGNLLGILYLCPVGHVALCGHHYL